MCNTMRKRLWVDTFNSVRHYSSPLMPVYALSSVALIFICCVLIDQARINLVEKPFLKIWDKKCGAIDRGIERSIQ